MAHEVVTSGSNAGIRAEFLSCVGRPDVAQVCCLDVTDVYGVGPIVAAFVVGYSGDITRFATAGHYASSNGGKKKHRLSLRGNRKLNHAIHMAAVTQIQYPDTPGRVYYDKKRAEGKTKKEALRALKRRISDSVYQHLVAYQN